METDFKDTLIIIPSDEPWSEIWHTQLHYGWELSRRFNVFYIAPPDKWNFLNFFKWKQTEEKINDRLLIIKYHNIFPLFIFKNFFVRLNDVFNSILIRKKISASVKKIIFWSFDHFRMLFPTLIKADYFIYHVVDCYIGQDNDAEMANKADLVITTSPEFLDYYLQLNKNVINIPQAVSRDEFLYDEATVRKIKNEFGRIILFIGTLTDYYSIELFESISDKFTDHTLLLIGPDKLSDEEDKKKFKNLIIKKNVKYIGPINGPELKNYVKSAEVGIIPYKFSHEREISIRSPLKTINYIAHKKPVITTINCEIHKLENNEIYTAENKNEFLELLEKAVNKKLYIDEKTIEDFLKTISYDIQIDFILSKIYQI
ncbi:MAG: glycosyltransferase [Bacteroidota bacterium]